MNGGPFEFLRLPLWAWRFWRKRLSARTLLLGMGASTIAVVMYGCIEGGSW